MAKVSKRRAFLERVSCRAQGRLLNPLELDTEFTRSHIDVACQALAMRLVALIEANDSEYIFRITRAGELLLDNQIEQAAHLIDYGSVPKRVAAPPPWGPLGTKLRLGGPGISLKGSSPRTYGTPLILAVASGHAIVVGDIVRGNANGPRSVVSESTVRGAAP